MRQSPTHDLSAFILAGGRSSRLGEPKALALLGGRTLLARAMEVVRAAGTEPQPVGPRDLLKGFGPVVEDLFPHAGPLGGIHAALSASATELNLIVAVDMPFLEPAFLIGLIDEARSTQALATVPRSPGGLQPLCAIYRSGFRALAQGALEKGEYKIDRLFTETNTRLVEASGRAGFAFPERMFDNLNTREELQRAQEVFKRRAT